jgi:hypothetical protein
MTTIQENRAEKNLLWLFCSVMFFIYTNNRIKEKIREETMEEREGGGRKERSEE